MLSLLRAQGVGEVLEDSSGNGGAAVAAYAALKGQELIGPMITGFKSLPARLAPPRMGSPVLAVAFLAAAALTVWGITRLG